MACPAMECSCSGDLACGSPDDEAVEPLSMDVAHLGGDGDEAPRSPAAPEKRKSTMRRFRKGLSRLRAKSVGVSRRGRSTSVAASKSVGASPRGSVVGKKTKARGPVKKPKKAASQDSVAETHYAATEDADAPVVLGPKGQQCPVKAVAVHVHKEVAERASVVKENVTQTASHVKDKAHDVSEKTKKHIKHIGEQTKHHAHNVKDKTMLLASKVTGRRRRGSGDGDGGDDEAEHHHVGAEDRCRANLRRSLEGRSEVRQVTGGWVYYCETDGQRRRR